MNALGIMAHHNLGPGDRYLWTLPMFHVNGWTFVWINTARGMTHVCLRQVEPAAVFRLIGEEGITMFCAAPTVLIGIANAPERMRAGAPKGVRLFTAGAPPAAATIETIERELGWELTHAYGLTETSPLITICEPRPAHRDLPVGERARIKARQGVDMLGSGHVRVVDGDGRDVPRDGETQGEIIVRGNVVMKGYYNDPEATAAAIRDGWFHSGDAAVMHPDGYIEIRDRFKGRHHQRRREYLLSGGRRLPAASPRGAGGRGRGHASREVGRVAACLRGAARRRRGDGGRSQAARTRQPGALQDTPMGELY